MENKQNKNGEIINKNTYNVFIKKLNEYSVTGDKHERSNEAGVDNIGDGGSGAVAGGRSGKPVTVLPSACWLSAGLLHDVACGVYIFVLGRVNLYILGWEWCVYHFCLLAMEYSTERSISLDESNRKLE